MGCGSSAAASATYLPFPDEDTEDSEGKHAESCMEQRLHAVTTQIDRQLAATALQAVIESRSEVGQDIIGTIERGKLLTREQKQLALEAYQAMQMHEDSEQRLDPARNSLTEAGKGESSATLVLK